MSLSKTTRKSRRSFKKKPTLRLLLVTHRIACDFDYSPELVSRIKAAPGARYEPASKLWYLPITSLAAINDGQRLFSSEDLELISSASASEISAARIRLNENPFSVSRADLVLSSPEVVLRGAEIGIGVRAICPRKGRASEALSEIRGVSFIEKESCLYLPTQELPAALKRLRDSGVTFGVEEQLGRRLKNTQLLRAKLIEGSQEIKRSDLERALLVPFIAEAEEGEGFELSWFTREQLRESFPNLAKRRSYQISAQDLVTAEFESKGRSFQIWLTEAASRAVSGEIANLTRSGALSLSLATQNTVAILAPKNLAKTLPVGLRAKLITQFAGMLQGEIELSELSLLVTQIGGKVELELSEELREKLSDLERFEAARTAARGYLELEDVAPAELLPLPLENSERLFPHQRVAVKFLSAHKRAFLGDDMGLGKTLSVLSTFRRLQLSGEAELLLVLAPASLLGNWYRESRRWYPELSALVASGDKTERTWLLRLLSKSRIESELLIINYEGARLEYMHKALIELISKRRAVICLDESQRVKNPQGKTFQALKTVVPLCERRILLSGTPTPRDISDLWSQLFLLDDGERFGKNFYKWLGSVAELGNRYSEFAVKRFIPERIDQSLRRFEELLLRRKKEEVVSLPEKTFVERYVELRGDQCQRYEEVREALLLRTTTGSGVEFTRQISNLLEEYLRAVQIASNPRLVDPNWQGTPAKFEELDDIVEEIVVQRGKKLVVWTNYLLNVSELCERYKAHRAAPFSGEVPAEERTKTVAAFQSDPNLKILVAVPAAGGVGITLTAADTAVYIDKTWNGEHWIQSIDRIHRIGQKGSVTILSLLSSRVDEMIHANLERKRTFQAEVFGSREEGIGQNQVSIAELREAVRISEEAYGKIRVGG